MIARGVGAAVVLLAFAGCNAVFGLDAVTQVDGGEGTDAVAIDSAGDGPTGEPDAATPIDAGCGGDLDCDGIGDAVDRCPGVFDPAQHDEDGDGPGDACDNCPGVPNPTQADSTEPGVGADGVGDACDPHPQARDRLVLFDPMTEASAWVTSNSGARIVGGDLQVTGDTGGAVFAVRPNLPPSSGHTHVMVAFTIDQFAPGMVGSIDRGVSLYLGANGTTAAGRSCAWLAPNTRLTAPTLSGTDPSGATVTASPVTDAMTTGIITVLAGHQVATDPANEAVHCYVRGASWGQTFETGAPNAGAFVNATIALASHRTALRYHWVAVYDHL